MVDGTVPLVDPAIFITNHGKHDRTLAWQTTVPERQLSPWRQATIRAGAMHHRVDPGLFWIVHPGSGQLLVDNTVFISVVNDDGSFDEQIAVGVEILADLSDLEHLGLAVTIDADGYLSAAAHLDV